jgi:cytochrome d ubiquinol oxidase subunit I
MVALGAVLSGFFSVATNAWMQHPVAYEIVDGRAQLTSLVGLLTNPYALTQYPHVISGSLVTASMVMAGIGAYYLLSRQFEVHGRLFLRVGVTAGLIFSVTQLFPTGALHGEHIAAFQPAKMAAMEGVFRTQEGAPMAIIGMPDREKGELMDPILVPRVLSYLAYGDFRAKVIGLNDFPEDERPPVELVYYAYHIMIGLGTIFIAINLLAAALLWRGTLFTQRWFLWIVMLAMPFPYIANHAGWVVAEVGRQPWVVHGLQRTAVATSTNVTDGMTTFTLLGFMGLYAVLGLLYLFLLARIVASGPVAGAPAAIGEPGATIQPAH